MYFYYYYYKWTDLSDKSQKRKPTQRDSQREECKSSAAVKLKEIQASSRILRWCLNTGNDDDNATSAGKLMIQFCGINTKSNSAL